MRVLIGLARTGAGRAREGLRRRDAHLATTRRAPRDDETRTSRRRDTHLATTRRAPRDDRSAARDDGYGSLKKIGRVQGRVTTGRGRARTAEIGQRQVSGGQRELRSRDVGLRNGQRRLRSHDVGLRNGQRRIASRATTGPTLRGRITSTVYKGEQINSGFTLRLVAPDPSSPGALCRTCAELL